MTFVVKLLAATSLSLAALSAQAADSTPPPNTDWAVSPVGEQELKVITTGLSDDANYFKFVNTRLCFKTIETHETRYYNGVYDRFNITGCAVTSTKDDGGKCKDKFECTPAKYSVEIKRQDYYPEFFVLEVTKTGEVTRPGCPGA